MLVSDLILRDDKLFYSYDFKKGKLNVTFSYLLPKELNIMTKLFHSGWNSVNYATYNLNYVSRTW